MLRYAILVLTLMLSSVQVVHAEVSLVVITHVDTPIQSLSRTQVKNLYLGAPQDFETTKLVLPSDSRLSQQFNTRVIGLSESRLRSYLAQMRFSGRAIPLTEVDSEAEVIQHVTEKYGVFGYVTSTTSLPSNVKVVYQLKVD